MKIEETDDAIYYITSSGIPIDKGIVKFINKINDFKFVGTRLSCQGHFVRDLTEAPLYYGKSANFKGKDSWFGKVTYSRIKPPFVILEFFDKVLCSEFIAHFIKKRRKWWNREIYVHFVTPKTRFVHLNPRAFILSKFERNFACVSMFLGKLYYFRYQTQKIKVNSYVKYMRTFMFKKIISALSKIDARWDFEKIESD